MRASDLFPYQAEGVSFLKAHKHACLWDDPGLGKTPQVLVAAESLGCKRILVICPALARRNWERETLAWSNFVPLVVETTNVYPGANFVVCSYEYARKRREWLTERTWDLVVVDEMHMCSNLGAGRTQAVLGCEGPCHSSDRVWVLSGTPLRNHAGELWPIFRTFGITDLDQEAWEDRYCRVVTYQGRRKVVGTKVNTLDELRALVETSGLCLRRRKREVLPQLPPVLHSEVTVAPAKNLDWMSFRSLTKYADNLPGLKRLVAQGVNQLQALLEAKGSDADSLLASLSAASDCIAVVRALTGIRKIQGVNDLVNAELDAGYYKKLVIFCHHRDVIEGIVQGVKDSRAIWGGQSPTVRDNTIQMFQTMSQPRVLVCQMDAAGVALNMTAAAACLIVEPPYVPAVAQQCIDRLNRIGQTEPVLCRWVVLPDESFDQSVISILRRKAASIRAILDAGGTK